MHHFEEYAEELGCNMGTLKATLDNHTHAKLVEDGDTTGNKAGIRGTPAAGINGYLMSSAQPEESTRFGGSFFAILHLAPALLHGGGGWGWGLWSRITARK